MMKTKIVEMTCKISEYPQKQKTLPAGFNIRSLEMTNEDDFYPCYLAAFQAGDSKLFLGQSEEEQPEFFKTLAFEQAKKEPGSCMIVKDKQIAGYTFIVPYGETNRHISCMCVHPDFQRQGLGSFMLNYAKEMAHVQGHKSITLWTEVAMGAYQLYIQHGFQITEEKVL